MKERKDRVDDALHATKAAAREGYVAGGGVALLRAIKVVENARAKAKGDEKLGYEIVAQALRAPAHQIAQNAGDDGDIVVDAILEKSGPYGFNAATREYGDLVRQGIIDPALVSREALINAASVAGLMLTTSVLIAEVKEDKEAEASAVA